MKWDYRAWLWLALLATLLAGPAGAGLFDRFGGPAQEQRVLEADQAFQLTISALDPLTLQARWVIEPGYYLYRDKFRLELVDASGMAIISTELPPGESKDDPYFGPQQVFHGEAVMIARLQRTSDSAGAVEVKAHYQGCAEVGVCYPPLSQTVAVALPAYAPLLEEEEPGIREDSPRPAGEGRGRGRKPNRTAWPDFSVNSDFWRFPPSLVSVCCWPSPPAYSPWCRSCPA